MKPTTLITLEFFYGLIGAIFAFMAVRIAVDRSHPRRWGSALFWGLLALTYLLGKVLPPAAVGYLMLGLVGLAAAGQVARSEVKGPTRAERVASAEKLQNRLFWPALLVPATAVGGTLLFGRLHWGNFSVFDRGQITLLALGVGALLAIAMALRTTGAPVHSPVVEGSRLLEAIGWALVLPQLLAALGGIFAQAGIGPVVADLVAQTLPTQFPVVAVAAYCLGMALFTICMGNAFAAFPVMTLGLGLPLIVQLHHGNAAVMAAIGMLSGYCGTLLTPMAANFNIVPAVLLELDDRHAVIKAQLPVALVVLAANIGLMYFAAFRFS
jgi:uncharacterized membrane protein